MTLAELLPHWNGLLNLVIALLLGAGYLAIRRGRRRLHPRLMLSATGSGVVFLGTYLLQVIVCGHQRFPGDDWVRTLFLVILGTHTLLALAVPPLVLRTIYLGWKERFAEHRRIAPIAFWVWAYVAVTGVVIYLMNTWRTRM